MAENSSHAVFLRAVAERHQMLRARMEQLVRTLVNDNVDDKTAKANDFLGSLTAFSDILDSAARPAWIQALEHRAQAFLRETGIGDRRYELIRQIMKTWPEVHAWKFDDSATAIDFDDVYREAYNGSRIPELFDALVSYLQQIIESGEIDSRNAVKQLQELIDLLKKNRNGSYGATWTTWQFALAVVPNLLREYAASSKTLGPLIKAVEKTMEQLGIEWPELHERIKQDLQAKFSFDLSRLSWSPKLLPGPKDVPGGEIIDVEVERKAE